MKKDGSGKIVNIGSIVSIFGAPFVPAYAASKGDIVQFSKVCANAWTKDNIQVNAVLPGWIDTERTPPRLRPRARTRRPRETRCNEVINRPGSLSH